MTIILPCIVCQKVLQGLGSGSPNHAADANEFRAHGQYGSTVFDPMDGSYLAVNICDACIKSAGLTDRVAEGARDSKELQLWKPR